MAAPRPRDPPPSRDLWVYCRRREDTRIKGCFIHPDLVWWCEGTKAMTDTSILEPRTSAAETPEAGAGETCQGTEQASTTSEQTDDPEKAIEELKRQLNDRKAPGEIPPVSEGSGAVAEQTDDPEKAIEDLKRQLKDRKAAEKLAMTWKIGSFLR